MSKKNNHHDLKNSITSYTKYCNKNNLSWEDCELAIVRMIVDKKEMQHKKERAFDMKKMIRIVEKFIQKNKNLFLALQAFLFLEKLLVLWNLKI